MRMKVTNNDDVSRVILISGDVIAIAPGETAYGFTPDGHADMALYLVTDGGTTVGDAAPVAVKNPTAKTLYWRDAPTGLAGSIPPDGTAYLTLRCVVNPADDPANMVTFRVSGPY